MPPPCYMETLLSIDNAQMEPTVTIDMDTFY